MQNEHKQDPSWRCNCHLKHSEKIQILDAGYNDNKNEIKNKVDYKYFALLVLILVSMLGFQWFNYDKLFDKLTKIDKNVSTRMAIIETKLGIHMDKIENLDGLNYKQR
jgi:hypothetical protein